MKKELMGASSGLLVLSVLAKESSYGYEIVNALNSAGMGTFIWQEGTVYPILHKLEQQKLLRSQWQDAASGRRRKYYYITAKGREVLAEGKEHWDILDKILTQMTEVML
jgi:PadR family transcriptional regulator, regulatory protein PadR